MLTEFAKRLYQKAAAAGGHDPETFGTLSDLKTHFDQPIYGEVNGEPVTIIGEGNMRGLSPVAWCVDAQHENAYLPVSEIRITDPRFQPVVAPGRTLR